MPSVIDLIENNDEYERPFAFGVGIAAVNRLGNPLEVYFPIPCYNSGFRTAAILAHVTGHRSGNKSYYLDDEKIVEFVDLMDKEFGNDDDVQRFRFLLQLRGQHQQKVLVTFLTTDAQPQNVEEVYLKLTLISHRRVMPHELNLDGIFRLMPNVAWTSEGPIDIAELSERQLRARLENKHIDVYGIDKFPKMANYHVPREVRIADAARVRLGAYLGPGTTIMQEGFVNFNAGTEGPNMVEGRISAGVFVKKGSDLGGGCSIMGTLSGGNETTISVAENCLIGANAGTGIPLGENCIIEAGLYITAGTKVEVLGKDGKAVEIVNARELAGKPNLLFRRNSRNGSVQVLPNEKDVSLNEDLHGNN